MATKFPPLQNKLFCVFLILSSGIIFSNCGQSAVRKDQVQVDENQDLINRLNHSNKDFDEIRTLINLSDENIQRMTDAEKILCAKKLYSYGCPVRSQNDSLALKTSLKILLEIHLDSLNERTISGLIINEHCLLGEFSEAREYIELIEISNPDIDYSFEKALILFKLNETKTANVILKKILDSLENKIYYDRGSINQQVFISMILFLLDRHEESIEKINQLSVNFPNELRIKLIKEKLITCSKDDLINYLLQIN